MSQASALDGLDRLVACLDEMDSGISPRAHMAAELLLDLDDIANGHGVARGEARWARGDEQIAAAILTELVDDHAAELYAIFGEQRPIG